MFKQLNQGAPGPPLSSKPAHLLYRPASPPLPPPETMQHPVFEGSRARPLVNLPGMNKTLEERPTPIVRLPPPHTMSQHALSTGVRTGQSFLHGPPQPLAKSIDWQNRFRGLFGREKRPSESAEFSISKTGFDILSVSEATAVNFPQPGQISPISAPPLFIGLGIKTVDEEAALFDEELHPGSTPPVRVPANKFGANWHAASPPSSVTVKKAALYILSDQSVSSCRAWDVGRDDFHRDKVNITIRLPGMTAAHTKSIDAARVKDSRQIRQLGAQQGRVHSKTHKKAKEAPAVANSRALPSAVAGVARAVVSVLPAVPTGPQTWAKRVSQGVPQSAN